MESSSPPNETATAVGANTGTGLQEISSLPDSTQLLLDPPSAASVPTREGLPTETSAVDQMLSLNSGATVHATSAHPTDIRDPLPNTASISVANPASSNDFDPTSWGFGQFFGWGSDCEPEVDLGLGLLNDMRPTTDALSAAWLMASRPSSPRDAARDTLANELTLGELPNFQAGRGDEYNARKTSGRDSNMDSERVQDNDTPWVSSANR